jgi:hypothetical protein
VSALTAVQLFAAQDDKQESGVALEAGRPPIILMKRVLILGAAGRDFHNFNVVFRHNREFEVVAFTATQIPDIAGRKYPP